MSNIYPFQPRRPKPQIRISAGTVTASTDLPDVGQLMYFLTFVEPDGSHMCVWDGVTYAAALAAALDWQCDGAVLVDETVQTLH